MAYTLTHKKKEEALSLSITLFMYSISLFSLSRGERVLEGFRGVDDR